MKNYYVFLAISITTFMLFACAGVSNPVQANPTRTFTTLPPTISSIEATPAAVSTITQLPTLSQANGLEVFTNLVEQNSNCRFPCFLGITPGKTKFDEAVNNLSQFSLIGTTEFSPQWASIRVFFPNFETYIHSTAIDVYPADNKGISRIWVYAGVNLNERKNITYDNPEYQKLWNRYFIPGIFTTYGQPGSIFLDTTLTAADAATSYPFVLWIVYPKNGFLIRYQGRNFETEDNISICPTQSRIEIIIWDLDRSSYEEFIEGDRALGISTSLGPQPIESVTNFDIESFFEKFKSGDINTCFDTPASIWPPN